MVIGTAYDLNLYGRWFGRSRSEHLDDEGGEATEMEIPKAENGTAATTEDASNHEGGGAADTTGVQDSARNEQSQTPAASRVNRGRLSAGSI